MNRLNERFTTDEARQKIGRRVRTAGKWPGVPSGATGIVVHADHGTVAIAWEPDGVRPPHDWFSKGEYTNFLREL